MEPDELRRLEEEAANTVDVGHAGLQLAQHLSALDPNKPEWRMQKICDWMRNKVRRHHIELDSPNYQNMMQIADALTEEEQHRFKMELFLAVTNG